MRALLLFSAALLGGAASAQPVQASGQVRVQWTETRANSIGPVAPVVDSGATVESELRASGHGLTAVGTLQQSRWRDRTADGKAWMNELYASHDAGAWQFSAGKKIVSWDVGYGFRPNDMVQQEERRTLVTTTPEGRAVLMGEHFGADTAWSVVAVNPTAPSAQSGADEPALAARAYLRDGAADWHAFARVGERNGASVGTALAWVANESVELHGSLRHNTQRDVAQALVGGTWTHASQLSVLMEAWWDGTAEGVSLSPSARRSNVFVRTSWLSGAWQPGLDVLYTPADQGFSVTASLLWQGDRVQVQGGVRNYGGPADAVLAQLPGRSTAFVAATLAF